MSVKGNRKLYRCCRKYFGPRTHRNAPLLGPCCNLYVCPLSPDRGGWRKQSDGLRSTLPLKILKTRMRSGRRRLCSSEKRLSWRSLSSYGTCRRPLTSRFARRWTLSKCKHDKLLRLTGLVAYLFWEPCRGKRA